MLPLFSALPSRQEIRKRVRKKKKNRKEAPAMSVRGGIGG